MTQALPESLTRDLTPWQQWFLEKALDPGFRGFDPHQVTMAARRTGKAAASRAYIAAMASSGTHVHATGRDGSWCVTRQPLGLLWARLPKGVKFCARCAP